MRNARAFATSTETIKLMKTESNVLPAAKKNNSIIAIVALAIALAACVLSLYPSIVHKIYNIIGIHTPAAPDYTNDINALNKRLAAIEEAQNRALSIKEPVIASDNIIERLAALEQHITHASEISTVQAAQLQEAARLPAALALIRLEERFERGQNFSEALALMNNLMPTPIGEDDSRVLLEASIGIMPTSALFEELDRNERRLRRDIRLAGVSSPVDRIWAELQSLILVRSDTVAPNDVVGRSLIDIKDALARGDQESFRAIWVSLPEVSKKRLDSWYVAATRRLAAHIVLQKIAHDLLVSSMGVRTLEK